MELMKEALRARLLERRKALSRKNVSEASKAIILQLPTVITWPHVKTVHVYHSLPELGELDTQPVIEWITKEHPHVQVVVGESSPRAPFPEGQFDVIFVPVLGFDREGFRLGMGGGWYDRWLATQPQAKKIGLAYTWAEIPHLPRQPHDIVLDKILRDEMQLDCHTNFIET